MPLKHVAICGQRHRGTSFGGGQTPPRRQHARLAAVARAGAPPSRRTAAERWKHQAERLAVGENRPAAGGLAAPRRASRRIVIPADRRAGPTNQRPESAGGARRRPQSPGAAPIPPHPDSRRMAEWSVDFRMSCKAAVTHRGFLRVAQSSPGHPTPRAPGGLTALFVSFKSDCLRVRTTSRRTHR